MGLLFPVICAAPLSKETLNRFIEENEVDAEGRFVFVDTLDDYYSEASEAPTEVDSNPNSSFIHKTPQECYELLLKLREDTESETITHYFAIMDERSTQDDTVLLVCASVDLDAENELTIQTIRASFQASVFALMLYETGHSSVGEDEERAERAGDTVYRG
ncbi:uncharacterized protein N7503_008574 [Penicillium pulvis]|uniref:uncharacterized protein n=1 Tax=Penicillium pulvis TaxID=1562058 RepID=UPI0025472E14|nr:uncharacterized protein N7503_008574 [Penicillium pulvis]KAJ5792596.1 hypothetical protein N7503_008574 [Penicillium pulvis]